MIEFFLFNPRLIVALISILGGLYCLLVCADEIKTLLVYWQTRKAGKHMRQKNSFIRLLSDSRAAYNKKRFQLSGLFYES